MNTKHTPGPWVSVGAWVEHPDDNIPDICTCNPEDMGQSYLPRSDQEILANARLIAAAPDMLQAIEELLILCDESDGSQYGTISTKYIRLVFKDIVARATGDEA